MRAVVFDKSLLAASMSVTASLNRMRISSGVRVAEMMVICPTRRSMGVRNEEKCMMTVAGGFESGWKSRKDIDLGYENRWPDVVLLRRMRGYLYFDLAKS